MIFLCNYLWNLLAISESLFLSSVHNLTFVILLDFQIHFCFKSKLWLVWFMAHDKCYFLIPIGKKWKMEISLLEPRLQKKWMYSVSVNSKLNLLTGGYSTRTSLLFAANFHKGCTLRRFVFDASVDISTLIENEQCPKWFVRGNESRNIRCVNLQTLSSLGTGASLIDLDQIENLASPTMIWFAGLILFFFSCPNRYATNMAWEKKALKGFPEEKKW